MDTTPKTGDRVRVEWGSRKKYGRVLSYQPKPDIVCVVVGPRIFYVRPEHVTVIKERRKAEAPTKIIYNGPGSERNDCTVQALSNATPLSYDEAHKILADAGRQNGTGFQFKGWLRNAGQTAIEGLRFARVYDWVDNSAVQYGLGNRGWKNNYTLGQFLKSKPEGNYIVIVRRHTFAVVDGVVMDATRNGARTRIHQIYKVVI